MMNTRDMLQRMFARKGEALKPLNESVVVEDDEPHPIFQGLMNTAYAKWRKGGELEGVDDKEFVGSLPEKEELAVRVGNMNYQVENGGWEQWWDNRYGPRDIDWLIDFFTKHQEYASFKKILALLDKVKGYSESPGEEECSDCLGSGYYEEEDPETGDIEEIGCSECGGSGYVETEEPHFSESLDDNYYDMNNQLMADMEKFLSSKEADIEKGEAPSVEESVSEKPAEKKRPRVKLVGTSGNAFAIIGTVVNALKKAGYSEEEVEQFKKEATSGDYNHLLATAMNWVDAY